MSVPYARIGVNLHESVSAAAAAVWSWAFGVWLHCDVWGKSGHASSPRSIKKICLMTTRPFLASVHPFLPQLGLFTLIKLFGIC